MFDLHFAGVSISKMADLDQILRIQESARIFEQREKPKSSSRVGAVTIAQGRFEFRSSGKVIGPC